MDAERAWYDGDDQTGAVAKYKDPRPPHKKMKLLHHRIIGTIC